MRIIITVEDSQQSPPNESSVITQSPAENAGAGLGAAAFSPAGDKTAASPSEAELTAGATSAGPAPDPASTNEPGFSPDSAETNPLAAGGSVGSTDLSAGPAPRIE